MTVLEEGDDDVDVSNGAIKQAVRAGLGVSLQSRVAVELELESSLLATIAVRGGLPERQWYVLRPATGPARAPVEEFEAFVAEAVHRDKATGVGWPP
jgi:DNA-binding transcriptional LysR family regulator